MKREFGELGSRGSRGCFAGVAPLGRALGSSGESGRPSCSAVQHSFDAMFALRDTKQTRGEAEEICILLTLDEAVPRGMAAKHTEKEGTHVTTRR